MVGNILSVEEEHLEVVKARQSIDLSGHVHLFALKTHSNVPQDSSQWQDPTGSQALEEAGWDLQDHQ